MDLVKTIMKDLNVGDLLVVETEKQTFKGRLQCVAPNRDFLILEDPQDIFNNILYSKQLITLDLITNIKKVKDENSDDDENFYTGCSEEDSAVKSLIATPHSSKDIRLYLSTFERRLMQQQIEYLIILSQKGQDYNKAIDDIRSQHVISVFTEPAKYGRHNETSFITIATVTKIYLFDIQCFKIFPAELKNIFAAERPKKAICFSNRVVDHFHSRHNIEINGVFDIFIAHCMVSKRKDNLGLKEIVEKYFNIPTDFFQDYGKCNYPTLTYSRPLKLSIIRECAKRAFFILKLQDQLESLMHKKFYAQCKLFSTSIINEQDILNVADSFLQNNIKLENISLSDEEDYDIMK